MSERDRPEARDPHLRGTHVLPRWWAAWSGEERNVWDRRLDLSERENALLHELRRLLGPEQQRLLNDFDTLKNEYAELQLEQVMVRLWRYRPDLHDLLMFAFDQVGFLHEDLIAQPDPHYIPS